jgi:hypothetical protein
VFFVRDLPDCSGIEQVILRGSLHLVLKIDSDLEEFAEIWIVLTEQVVE